MLTFRIPRLVYFLENLEHIRATFPCLRVPKESPFWAEVIVNEIGDGRTEGLFHIATDPDKEPVGRLKTRGQGSAETGTCADSDSTLVDGCCVRNAGELITS